MASDALNERKAFATPVAHTGNDRSRNGPCHRLLDSRGVEWREQFTVVDRKRRNRNIHDELRLDAMTEMAPRGPHCKLWMALEETALLRRCGLAAGRARDDDGIGGAPHLLQ